MGKFNVHFKFDVKVEMPIDLEDIEPGDNVIDILDKNQYNDIIAAALSEINEMNSNVTEIIYEQDESEDVSKSPANISIYVEDWFEDNTSENSYTTTFDRIKDLQAMADGNNIGMVHDCINDLDYDIEDIDIEAVTHQLQVLAKGRLFCLIK